MRQIQEEGNRWRREDRGKTKCSEGGEWRREDKSVSMMRRVSIERLSPMSGAVKGCGKRLSTQEKTREEEEIIWPNVSWCQKSGESRLSLWTQPWDYLPLLVCSNPSTSLSSSSSLSLQSLLLSTAHPKGPASGEKRCTLENGATVKMAVVTLEWGQSSKFQNKLLNEMYCIFRNMGGLLGYSL